MTRRRNTPIDNSTGDTTTTGAAPVVEEIEFAELSKITSGDQPLIGWDPEIIENVEVQLEISIGTATISVGTLFDLRRDSIVKIDRLVDEPVDLLLNGRLVAKGQLVVVEDNFGIRITEIKSGDGV